MTASNFVSITARDYADIIVLANAAPLDRQDMAFLTTLLRAARDNIAISVADHALWTELRQRYEAFLSQHFP